MKLISLLQPTFPLGQIVITPHALEILTQEEITAGLQRLARQDWGDVCPEDAALNDAALIQGDRLLSAYGADTKRFWIITESDRSVTTILMPDDY